MHHATVVCLICLIAVLMCCLVACGNTSVPQYSFTQPENDFSYYDWRVLKSDDEITLDGQMDEALWNTQSALIFGDTDIRMHVKTYFGEKALYVGIYVEDREVYSNPERADWRNSGVELHLASAKATARTEAIQLRIEADGRMGSLIGVDETFTNLDKAVIQYGWNYDYVPFYAKVSVDGELNTSECNGVGFEVMIPWKSLHMEGKGDCLILPAYNHTSGYGMEEGVGRKHIQASGNMNDVQSYQPFGATGFTGYNEEATDILGASVTGRLGTTGWDMSEKAEGIAASVKSGQQYVFFKQAQLASSYTVTTTVSHVTSLSGTGKVGIICGMNSQQWMAVFVVFHDDGSQSVDVIEMDDYGWYYGQSESVNLSDELTGGSFTMRVERENEQVSVYINDALVMETTSTFLSQDGIPGFFTIDAKAQYSQYSYINDECEDK